MLNILNKTDNLSDVAGSVLDASTHADGGATGGMNGGLGGTGAPERKLTIGEAQELFVTHLRRPLSDRSLQRYCASGVIEAELTSHSQGTEWMIAKASLERFILKRPVSMAEGGEILTPRELSRIDRIAPTEAATVAIAPERVSAPTSPSVAPVVASITAARAETASKGDTDPGPNPETADSVDEYADPKTVGERRQLGDVLVENARLSASLVGKDEVIATLKSHETYLQSEVSHSRTLIQSLTGDVARISSQMLQTMQSIATSRIRLQANDEAEERGRSGRWLGRWDKKEGGDQADETRES